MRRARALVASLVLSSFATTARADVPVRTALFVEASTGWIPFANDVPWMLSVGVRFARVHELWGRGGFIPTGDDVRLGLGAIGYRVAFAPESVLRPIVGVLAAGLPETCGHDALGRPSCERTPIFVFAATLGARIEPVRWFGIYATIAAGVDTYPNPFGMIETGLTFAWPTDKSASTQTVRR